MYPSHVINFSFVSCCCTSSNVLQAATFTFRSEKLWHKKLPTWFRNKMAASESVSICKALVCALQNTCVLPVSQPEKILISADAVSPLTENRWKCGREYAGARDPLQRCVNNKPPSHVLETWCMLYSSKKSVNKWILLKNVVINIKS